MTCVTLVSSASVLWREQNTSGSESIAVLAWPYKNYTKIWWVPSTGKCLALSLRKNWPSPCWPPFLLNVIWLGRSLSHFLSNLWPTFHQFSLLLSVILPKYCPKGPETSHEFHGSYADSNRGDANGWTPWEGGQVEDFICFLQLHLLWAAFSGSSIPFPIKLNSLLTGLACGDGADGIHRGFSPLSPPCNNHRSLLSKSVGNGVWTLRNSSVYPFYLFLICINGNSVCFNLCGGTGRRTEEVPFSFLFTPISHRWANLFWWAGTVSPSVLLSGPYQWAFASYHI